MKSLRRMEFGTAPCRMTVAGADGVASLAMTVDEKRDCCVCDTPMEQQIEPWCLRCTLCGTWGSTLDVDINGASSEALDEESREYGLETLRRQNFALVLDRLAQLRPLAGARLLDVGAAHGWFLESAAARGMRAVGIEPDEQVARRSGLGQEKVRVGFFPDVLSQDETFDVITFHDVMEHMPDVDAAVSACWRHLSPGGVLVLNLPNSRGIVYRLAALAARWGLKTPFRRLWQVGLPSPHLWYFDARGLAKLCTRHGFDVVHEGRLPAMARRGLWQRLHADRRPTPLSLVGFGALTLLAPLLNARVTSDILLLMLVKRP